MPLPMVVEVMPSCPHLRFCQDPALLNVYRVKAINSTFEHFQQIPEHKPQETLKF